VRWEDVFGHDVLAEKVRHAARGSFAKVHHKTGTAIFLPLNVADMDFIRLDPAIVEKVRRAARVG
jgi:bifunctional pyridoxal-dependent enzyme with beta-cystathionase and maltose regulon repressor activities